MGIGGKVTTALTRVERQIEGHSTAFVDGMTAGYFGRRRQSAAVDSWADFRAAAGYKRSAAKILTPAASQHKLSMSTETTVGLMLTPERGVMRSEFDDLRAAYGLDGAWNLCPMASRGCAAACLSFSGQSGMPAQQFAQGVRTLFMLHDPRSFLWLVGFELGRLSAKHGSVAVRLNTVSDIRWEKVMHDGMQVARDAFHVTWYDYTKFTPAQRPERAGYDLTRSASERHSVADIVDLVRSGERVAVPFFAGKTDAFPETWNGLPVIDGDTSDYRPADPKGSVLALRVKGHKGARDESGFIRNL
jgi:hypothetical protein